MQTATNLIFFQPAVQNVGFEIFVNTLCNIRRKNGQPEDLFFHNFWVYIYFDCLTILYPFF